MCPTNVYFDTGTIPEQNLYEDLMIEQLKIYGQDTYYIPRTLTNEDTLFGEDPASTFGDAYLIEMYFENFDGYEGEKELMSKFGIQMNDDATFIVAKRRFEQLVSIDNNLIVSSRPNEGDLIYFPKVSKIFEIKFVDHDDPFYQVHNVPAYKLRCSTFEYSSEGIDTGISEIDQIEEDNSTDQLLYQMSLEQQSTYNEDIRLEDGSGLLLEETDGDNIIGEDEEMSGAIIVENDTGTGDPEYIVQEVFVLETIDENSQNDLFEREDDILDWSEDNPFGNIGQYE